MSYLKRIILVSVALFILISSLFSQSTTWQNEKKGAILFGLTQPLVVRGFNVETNYIHNRLIFDYSHGASLDFTGNLLPDYLQNQGVVVHMPFSTGFGIGYRFTEWLNLRIEPKWHRFEFYYEDDQQIASNRIAVDANNYSIGLGLYGFFQPFKTTKSRLNGFTIAPSIRFWPTLSSSFDNNEFRYQNRNTGNFETLESLASGIGFSPLIVNISVGYSFDFKKGKR